VNLTAKYPIAAFYEDGGAFGEDVEALNEDFLVLKQEGYFGEGLEGYRRGYTHLQIPSAISTRKAQ
jgi:hypothetical protein